MNRHHIAWSVALLLAGMASGYYLGVEKVRSGLVENYPLFMNTVSNATVTVDSVYETEIDNNSPKALHDLIMSLSNAEITRLKIPYRAVYGCDLSAKNYKLNRSGNSLDVLLPAPYVYHLELLTGHLSLNDLRVTVSSDKLAPLKKLLAEELSVPLSKNKNHLQKARGQIATHLMWLFMPYGFELNIYFDNQKMELPQVPGLNRDADEYLKERMTPHAPATGH